MRVELVIAGSVADVTDDAKAAIATAIASAAGVDPAAVVITVVAASVRIIADITFESKEQRDAGQSTLATAVATPEAATSLLAAASVTVLEAPTVATVDEPSSSKPSGLSSAGAAGGAVETVTPMSDTVVASIMMAVLASFTLCIVLARAIHERRMRALHAKADARLEAIRAKIDAINQARYAAIAEYAALRAEHQLPSSRPLPDIQVRQPVTV